MTTPYQLTSDVLEAQFGPVKAQILYQTEHQRLICSRVVATGQVLELSAVWFDPAGVQAYPQIHRQIRDGTMMGKAFRAAGVSLQRQEQDRFAVTLSAGLSDLFGTKAEATGLVTRVIVGDHHTHYAEICELYSSTVVWPKA